MPPRYTAEEATAAIAASRSWAEVLERLGMCRTGGAYRVLQKYAARWGISTTHFDPYATQRRGRQRRLAIEEILVENSTYSRNHLKERLYAEGLKARVCEQCGQGELWQGRHMALVLDHVNGVANDNRLENLRILCPNCAATLETHCGRKNLRPWSSRVCERCGESFHPGYRTQRYCSRYCGSRWDRNGRPAPAARRVERPPYAQLIREVTAIGYRAVGRRYGVSDNAVRKWVRAYEAAMAVEDDRSRRA